MGSEKIELFIHPDFGPIQRSIVTETNFRSRAASRKSLKVRSKMAINEKTEMVRSKDP